MILHLDIWVLSEMHASISLLMKSFWIGPSVFIKLTWQGSRVEKRYIHSTEVVWSCVHMGGVLFSWNRNKLEHWQHGIRGGCSSKPAFSSGAFMTGTCECSLHPMEASEAFYVMGTAPLRICWADSQRKEMREGRGQPYSASSIHKNLRDLGAQKSP